MATPDKAEGYRVPGPTPVLHAPQALMRTWVPGTHKHSPPQSPCTGVRSSESLTGPGTSASPRAVLRDQWGTQISNPHALLPSLGKCQTPTQPSKPTSAATALCSAPSRPPCCQRLPPQMPSPLVINFHGESVGWGQLCPSRSPAGVEVGAQHSSVHA